MLCLKKKKKKKGVKFNENNKRNTKYADVVEDDAQDNEGFFPDISLCNCVKIQT